MIGTVLQTLGFIGMVTLLFICLVLSRTKNVHYFLVAGQDTFKWMCLLLVSIVIGRLLTTSGVISTELVRNINSVVFLATVGGIIWSVSRHGRPTRP